MRKRPLTDRARRGLVEISARSRVGATGGKAPTTESRTKMAKQHKGARVLEAIVEQDMSELPNFAFGGEETQVDIRPKTVVPVGYKSAYRARAAALGRTSKAAKRSNSDWLAQELEAECIGKGGAFDLQRFLAIFHANTGEDALVRWPNRNNGWEGRLRMSGAIVLRGVVGKRGTFRTPEGETNLHEVEDSLVREFLAKWDGRNS